jgi:hypothetical protein
MPWCIYGQANCSCVSGCDCLREWERVNIPTLFFQNSLKCCTGESALTSQASVIITSTLFFQNPLKGLALLHRCERSHISRELQYYTHALLSECIMVAGPVAQLKVHSHPMWAQEKARSHIPSELKSRQASNSHALVCVCVCVGSLYLCELGRIWK